jgi:PleD family two-component response regulator
MRRDVGRQFDPALFRAFDELVRIAMTRRLRLLTPRVIAPQPAPQPSGGAPDELTGLPLRRAFFHRAESALATRYGSNADVSLLVLDVDRFKLVNDTFGHLQSDVMRSVATTLKAALRTNDLWRGMRATSS